MNTFFSSVAGNIGEPDEIMVFADTIINVTCEGDNNGMLSLSASGGNGDYIFIIQNDTTTNGEFADLEAGFYNVLVADSVGCEGYGSFVVDDAMTPPHLAARGGIMVVGQGTLQSSKGDDGQYSLET